MKSPWDSIPRFIITNISIESDKNIKTPREEREDRERIERNIEAKSGWWFIMED